jgi:hypothetical protein
MINVRNMFWLMTTPVITAAVCWLIWTMIV